jgi:hypothetical protein
MSMPGPGNGGDRANVGTELVDAAIKSLGITPDEAAEHLGLRIEEVTRTFQALGALAQGNEVGFDHSNEGDKQAVSLGWNADTGRLFLRLALGSAEGERVPVPESAVLQAS